MKRVSCPNISVVLEHTSLTVCKARLQMQVSRLFNRIKPHHNPILQSIFMIDAHAHIFLAGTRDVSKHVSFGLIKGLQFRLAML